MLCVPCAAKVGAAHTKNPECPGIQLFVLTTGTNNYTNINKGEENEKTAYNSRAAAGGTDHRGVRGQRTDTDTHADGNAHTVADTYADTRERGVYRRRLLHNANRYGGR
jgi:pyruvate/2-oxoacid:ferredoxin oxidoreductase alpha subunit